MKILPVVNDVKNSIKKIIKNNECTDIKPIKNYAQYIKEYGLK